MKIKTIIRKIFRKPAIFFVTLWANYAYRKGVDAANRRHTLEGGRRIYLACDSWRPDHLVTYNREQFRAEKHVYGYHARLLTMATLQRGCYYYTPDQFGNNGLSKKAQEKRRRFFIEERLKLAKLI